MKKTGLALLALAALAGCGDDESSGALTADEQQRLENIADRLDEEPLDVGLEPAANGAEEQAPPENGL